MKRKIGPIGASLAGATATLLGQAIPGVAVAQELAPWALNTTALYYAESDGRVKDRSFRGTARKEVGEDRFVDIDVGIDSLTGASPSGAVPTGEIHTYTTPSGNLRTEAAGDLPLDDSFKFPALAIEDIRPGSFKFLVHQ